MPMVSPTLNLPTLSTSSSASAKPAGPMPPPALPAMPAPPTPPSPPSTTVSLSPQAMSLASSHASSPSPSNSTQGASAPAADAQGGSIYDSLKHGIAAAIDDVGDAIAGGAHAIVSGVETALSTVNDVAVGIVELPFAAVAKTADAAGALIDEL